MATQLLVAAASASAAHNHNHNQLIEDQDEIAEKEDSWKEGIRAKKKRVTELHVCILVNLQLLRESTACYGIRVWQ
jgi:hypothetical protein